MNIGLKRWIFLLICIIWQYAAGEVIQNSPLSVDQAFPLTVWSSSSNPEMVIVEWDIQPGYYLYKDRIHIVPTDSKRVSLGELQFPPSQEHNSPVLGKFAAFEGLTQIKVPLLSSPTDNFSLQIQYQGCAQQGYCYPPQIRIMNVVPEQGVDVIPQSTSTPEPVKALQSKHLNWMVWLGLFGVGLLIAFTPCVLPMIPILLSLILGKEHTSHWRSFIISLAYVLGMSFAYACAGVLFGLLGASVQAYFQKPAVIIGFSLIFVVMALSLWGLFQFEPPPHWRAFVARLSQRQQQGSVWGAAVMGVLSALILSPCATPALVGVLAYISQTGNAYVGGLALWIVGLGSGAPLLLIGAFGRRLLPKTGPWMRAVENILGMVLMGMGIFILGRILPDRITWVLWSALAIGIAIYLKTFQNTFTRIQLLGKGIGILLFIYGILLLVGTTQGANRLLAPLQFNKESCVAKPQFVTVKSTADVAAEMAKAKGKPIILDFYADWCVSCKILEKKIFNDPEVQKRLADYLLLRADITHNDTTDQNLMHQYRVIAPPTLLLFNSQHQELTQKRIVGEISVSEFLRRLDEKT